MGHMYNTMQYYSVIKQNKIMPFVATWMELEIIALSKVNQKEKDKYHNTTSLICGTCNMTYTNLSMKQKQNHRHRKQTCGCQERGV